MRNVTFSLLGLLVISMALPLLFAGNDLTEQDRIITNLSKRHTIEAETTRIKDIRNTQIGALIEVMNTCQRAMTEDKEFVGESGSAAIRLLGDLRAAEAVPPVIDFMCFVIDDKTAQLATGTDYECTVSDFQSAVYDALPKIGKPAVKPLISLLQNGAVRTHFGQGNMTEAEKQKYIADEEKFAAKGGRSSSTEKSKFARKTLYLIEGDCAIHHLERAYNSEPDKIKKDRLAEAIAKFKEELKSGAYK